MTAVKEKAHAPIHNDNLKNLKPIKGKKESPLTEKTPVENKAPEVSKEASSLNTEGPTKPETNLDATTAATKATDVASTLAKAPVLPIIVPKKETKLDKKLSDAPKEKINYIKKPAVIFIEGFSAFGISNGDGIKDMADNFPGAKRFSWDEKDKIVSEIKKHTHDQPVVLIGHSFGGDSAVEIASELNNVKNAFRPVDLLITIDSVGFNNTIMPMNVRRNLNFFQEGIVPFLHGSPNIARNTDYTDVVNELRSELHSRIEDSEEVQYKIFESINEVLGDFTNKDVFEEISMNEILKSLIDNQMNKEKP